MNDIIMREDELKPCPFCGGAARIQTGKVFGIVNFYPRCTSGGDSEDKRKKHGTCVGNQGWVGFSSESDAIKYWNRRGNPKLWEEK